MHFGAQRQFKYLYNMQFIFYLYNVLYVLTTDIQNSVSHYIVVDVLEIIYAFNY